MIVRAAWSNNLGLHKRVFSGTTGYSFLPPTFGTRNATLILFLLQTGVVPHIATPTHQTCFYALVVLRCLSLVAGFLFWWSKF